MSTTSHAADSLPVTSSAGDDTDRGAAIRARIEALGISDREWHNTTGIDRKTLHRAMNNQPGTRPATYLAIESELDRLEAKMTGRPTAQVQPEPPSLVRIEVQNVYGAKALVFESTPDNLPEVEAMIDRIMRRLATEQGDTPHGDTPEA